MAVIFGNIYLANQLFESLSNPMTKMDSANFATCVIIKILHTYNLVPKIFYKFAEEWQKLAFQEELR